MFSFSKLLALAAILAAVWFGFRLFNRLQQTREAIDKHKQRQEAARDGRPDPTRTASEGGDTVELVRDEKTGAFVPRDKTDRRA